jgi:EAL and modified HD-GYP domain-containing signal transduction protein
VDLAETIGMQHVFIGRQPILDREGKLYGYELLHRQNRDDQSSCSDGDGVSSDMLLNVVLDIGIQQISGAHRSFINMTRNLLLNPGLDALPSEQIVLEVLETVPGDAALIERLRGLRNRKFEIALDDYVHTPERDALIDLADIVKLDVLALDERTLERHVALLKKRKVRLLAEKVETPAMHRRLLDLGFDLFQGYYFARPEIYESRKILPNRLVLLEVLARINEPNITPGELSSIIRGDVSMCVTVLRWANGSVFGLRRPVESVERAIVVLGLQTIRNWVALLALARMGTHPSELLKMLLVRARGCELLASTADRPNPSSYFTVGLLSALDVILQMDMAAALERMPLAPEQKAALSDRSGDHGASLESVMAMERGDLERASFHGLNHDDIAQCYLSALAWADSLSRTGI